MSSELVTIARREIETSLQVLQREKARECVLLWLGRRETSSAEVTEVYRPDQIASADYFEIPRASIASLFTQLRTHNLAVLAQVHTHPLQAFHSAADDRWAIVRHVGALSLVLPYFAQRTTAESFWRDVAVFRLSTTNRWLEVMPSSRNGILQER